MVLDDSSTPPAVSNFMKMVQASGQRAARLSISKMRAAVPAGTRALDLVYIPE